MKTTSVLHTHTVAPGTFFLCAFFANVVQCGRHRLAFFDHVCPVGCGWWVYIGWTLAVGCGWWVYIPHNESVVCFGIACKWRSIFCFGSLLFFITFRIQEKHQAAVVKTISLLQISVGNVPIAFRSRVLPVLLFRQGS
jgi:hypothetical protein